MVSIKDELKIELDRVGKRKDKETRGERGGEKK